MRNTHNEPQEGDHTNTESQKHPNWLIQFRRKYVDGKVATWTLPTLGPIYINAKSATAITFSCSGYASNPVLTMAYTVHARLEGTF